MKIGVVHVNTEAASGPYTELISANLERARSHDTELVHRYVKHLRRATDTAIAYPTLLNKVDVIAEMVQLEADGVDAVMVACSGDPGVVEARTLLQIPVVGPMEAGMLVACGYGRRFGIVTVADRTWSGYMEETVQLHGLNDRYAGQRQLETPTHVIFTKGFEDREMVADDIRARATEMVDAGAEVILMGSAGLSTFASYCGVTQIDDPEVPIFDVISIGLKMAEMRVEIQKKMGGPPVSRAGWFSHYPPSERERVDRQFGFLDRPDS